MINTFQIWAHKLQQLLPSRQISTSFQTANTLFHVENRVTNLLFQTQADPDAVHATTIKSGSEELYQNIALPASMFLPAFRNSEGATELVQLQPYDRMLFTYDNSNTVLTFDNIQTCFIGHNDYEGDWKLELIRPFTYLTAPATVPGNGFLERTIFIDPIADDKTGQKQYGMLVKAFVGHFPVGAVTCIIQDKGSQYQLMNEPVLMENFVYDFRNENNFKPAPFSPWIAPQRHEYRVVFQNLTREPIDVQIGFFGNLCKFSVS